MTEIRNLCPAGLAGTFAFNVEVAESAAAARHTLRGTQARLQGHILELAVGEAAVRYFALPVAGAIVAVADLCIDVAVTGENVDPAVVLEIEEARSPAEKSRAVQKGNVGLRQ